MPLKLERVTAVWESGEGVYNMSLDFGDLMVGCLLPQHWTPEQIAGRLREFAAIVEKTAARIERDTT